MSLENFRNKFIVLEGIDGVGKSTIVQYLSNYLNNNNINSITTLEPGDWGSNLLGKTFRDYCKNREYDFTDLSILLLFYIDRQQNINNVILPNLEKGNTVILDRFTLSSRAYQFYGKKLCDKYNITKEKMEWLLDLSTTTELGFFLKPDYTIYLQRNVEKDLDMNDRFENNNEFKKRVKEGYEKEIQNSKDIVVIDVIENDISGTLQKIIDKISELR